MFDRHARSGRILLSAALLLAAIPLAASAAEPRSVAVRVGDLNLDSDAGRAVLRSRIDQAVETICGDVHMRTSWDVRAETISCTKAARAGATSQFDALVAAARSSKKVAADGGDTRPVR
jgi:UrcA family protein